MKSSFAVAGGLRPHRNGRRRALLGGTALAGVLCAGVMLAPDQALAANECGPIPAGSSVSVTCTAPTPAGGVANNGIEYGPSNSMFTLNIGNGTPSGAVAVIAPAILGVGQYGVVVGGGLGFPSPVTIPSAGANSSVVVNVREFSQVQGSGGGVFVWTTGSGHDATITNHGSVLTPGTGLGATGIGLNAVSNSGNASVTNYADGAVNALNNTMNGYSLSGSSTVTLHNDGALTSQRRDGISSVDPALGVLPTAGAATAENNGSINAGRNGINLGAAGDATVTLGADSVINAGSYTSGSGVIAYSVGGNVVISGDAASQTSSQTGPGIVGAALAGSSTVDAGIVNSGSDNLAIAGFTLPSISVPILGSLGLSGGVMSLANGDAIANAHGDITTTGTFGVLAFSATGAATATSDAGITIDPAIGMSSIVLAGTSDATVVNNATIIADSVGLLALNTGAGNAVISNTGATVGPSATPSPIFASAVAVAVGADADATITNTQSGVLNGAVVMVSGRDSILTNSDQSQINIGDVSAIVMLAGRDAAIDNSGGSSINLAGPLSFNFMAAGNDATISNSTGASFNINGPVSANIMVAGQDAKITNDRGGQFNITGDLTGNVMGAGRDAIVTNDRGGSFSMNGNLSGNVMVADQNATILNDRGGSFTMNGNLSGNIMVAGQDATITNDRGGRFTMNGDLLTGNFMVADQNATITNDRGGRFTMNGNLSGNVMVAGQDATITNDRGGRFTMNGDLLTGNFMVAGQNAAITNDHRGRFTIGGDLSGNVMVANQDATITNDRGGRFTIDGDLSGNFMDAGQNAAITNDRGGAFSLTGNILSGSFMNAGQDATITNDRGGTFSISGILNGNVMVANQNATVTNDRGGAFILAGVLNGSLMSAGQDATITNTRGGQYNLLGVNGTLMTAGNDAIITNASGGSLNLVGINDITLVANNDATIDNQAGGTIRLIGDNTVTLIAGAGTATINNAAGASIVTDGVARFVLSGSDVNNSANNGWSNADCNSLNGICVNGLATFSGAPGSQLQFNNAGGLVSMINGFSDYGVLTVPGFNTGLGDLVVVNGNFNGTGNSQLGVDAVLAGTGNSSSDMLVVTDIGNQGAVTGQTGLIVANGNNPGQYNPVGIPIVSVTSGQTAFNNFFIDPQSDWYAIKGGQGVIDKGMFFYAHDLVPSPNIPGGQVHVLKGLPDEEAFQLAYVTSGAQSIWYETANNWIDKQDELRSNMARAAAPSAAPLYTKAPPKPTLAPQAEWSMWARGIGSWTRRDATQSISTLNQTFTHDLGYKQDTYGFLVGLDWTKASPVDTVQFGVLGGYVDSTLKFDSLTAPSRFSYRGGVVGATATYINRGWFIDGLFKADFLDVDIAMPSLAAFGASGTSVDVTSIGAMGNAGYRFSFGASYLELLGTLAYVSTSVDSATLQGLGLNWADGKSFRGAIGGRVGTTWQVSPTQVVDVSLVGRVWNEWEGRNSVTIVSAGPNLTLTDGAMTNRPFGEVTAMVSLANLGSGWSGFVNGGAKFNSDFTTVTGKAGVRYKW